jgi:hypothetical protein
LGCEARDTFFFQVVREVRGGAGRCAVLLGGPAPAWLIRPAAVILGSQYAGDGDVGCFHFSVQRASGWQERLLRPVADNRNPGTASMAMVGGDIPGGLLRLAQVQVLRQDMVGDKAGFADGWAAADNYEGPGDRTEAQLCRDGSQQALR